MTASQTGRASIDGGARGNPGDAGCGIVLDALEQHLAHRPERRVDQLRTVVVGHDLEPAGQHVADMRRGPADAVEGFDGQLDPGLVRTGPDSLRREFELLARLRHPAVVAVHELGFAPDGTLRWTFRTPGNGQPPNNAEIAAWEPPNSPATSETMRPVMIRFAKRSRGRPNSHTMRHKTGIHLVISSTVPRLGKLIHMLMM